MRFKFFALLVTLNLTLSLCALAQDNQSTDGRPMNGGDFSENMHGPKVPSGIILVHGALPSASDSVTPLPESGRLVDNDYTNEYFGLSYPLLSDWTETVKGPPPSDSGYYVLSQLKRRNTSTASNKATILIAAQDLFFGPAPARDAAQMVKYVSDTLNRDVYKIDRLPAEIKIANHSFARMDYTSPVAGLHWYLLATEIRCHVVEFILMSRDTALLDNLVQSMEKTRLPAEAGTNAGMGGGTFPVCIKNYATDKNVIDRVDPVFADRKFNSVPVRIIIGKDGRVKHIHIISAFSEQTKAITDALFQWTFKPYLINGEPVEVETGIMFGASANQRKSSSRTALSD